MKIHRINPLTKLPIIVDLDITEIEMNRHFNGELIQKVWPNLSSDEREFYLSGVPMGLFEIQFEKHFVITILARNGLRYELYIAKSLLSFDKSKLNIFCYHYFNDEFNGFKRYNFTINKDNKFIIFGENLYKKSIHDFQDVLSNNQELIDFCLLFEKTKNI